MQKLRSLLKRKASLRLHYHKYFENLTLSLKANTKLFENMKTKNLPAKT
jgi:hypothetical protein